MSYHKTRKRQRAQKSKGGANTKNKNKNKTHKKILNLIKKPNSYYAFSANNKSIWPSKYYNTAIQTLEETPINDINESKLVSLLHELESVQLNKYSPNELGELRALVKYERSPQRGKIYTGRMSETGYLNEVTIENRIRNILERQSPLKTEKIVWRGQSKLRQEGKTPECKILPISWFSTSTDERIAKYYAITGKCLFKIHLMPGVRCFNLYDIYKEYGMTNPFKEQKKVRALLHNPSFLTESDYSKYGEVIVEEGGRFCKDPLGKEEGFLDQGMTDVKERPIVNNDGNLEFKRIGYKHKLQLWETWYFPPPEGYKSNTSFNWNIFGNVLNSRNLLSNNENEEDSQYINSNLNTNENNESNNNSSNSK